MVRKSVTMVCLLVVLAVVYLLVWLARLLWRRAIILHGVYFIFANTSGVGLGSPAIFHATMGSGNCL